MGLYPGSNRYIQFDTSRLDENRLTTGLYDWEIASGGASKVYTINARIFSTPRGTDLDNLGGVTKKVENCSIHRHFIF
jgi:hypothetical protein